MTKRMFKEDHTITWVLKSDPKQTVHQSPNVFTKERAEYLCKMANDTFEQAIHSIRRL